MARHMKWNGIGNGRMTTDPIEEYRKAAKRIVGGEIKRGREFPDPFARVAMGQIHTLGDGCFQTRSHGT